MSKSTVAFVGDRSKADKLRKEDAILLQDIRLYLMKDRWEMVLLEQN